MWHKKKWITLTAMVATLILLAGVIGGVVYAQGGDTPQSDNNPRATLMAKVSTILGIDQQTLESAFNQAQKEMQDEALANQLMGMVEQGTITQQQADQYKQWWQSRPDVAPELGMRGGFPGHGPGSGMNPPSPPPATNTN